jgi:uncharacterized protein YecT (DUF1311 family)
MSNTHRGGCFLLVALVIGAAWCRPATGAEHWAPDQNKCNEPPNTLAIIDCIEARTKFWDDRLNQAYKAAITSSQHPDMNSRVAPLQAGQREWVKYRDADCTGYHGSEQGTIRQIEVANCLLEMTQTRAIGRGAAIGSERDMLMRPPSVTP